jgi:MFS family permease
VDIALLCFLANFIAHSDRIAISVAITPMMRESGWDTAEAGWVLSGFFFGYTLLMVPVGLLVQRYGPKPILAACMAWWSTSTLLTPLAQSLPFLTTIRVLLGMGESGTASCINATLVRWFPPVEYSRATALCWSAGYAGPVLAVPAASYLLHLFGWRSIFWAFGIVGFLWLIWWRRVEQGPQIQTQAAESAPWPKILRSRSIWALFSLHFSANWFLYFMVSWLPTYLTNERHLSLPAMAAGSSLSFLCAWIGANFSAQVLDRSGTGVHRTRASKLLLLPYSLSALCLLATASVTATPMAVALLCASMALLGSITPVFSSGSLDLTPRHAGVVASAQNAFANFAGILAPVIIGYLVKGAGWPAAFTVTALVIGGGATIYGLLGSTEHLDV